MHVEHDCFPASISEQPSTPSWIELLEAHQQEQPQGYCPAVVGRPDPGALRRQQLRLAGALRGSGGDARLAIVYLTRYDDAGDHKRERIRYELYCIPVRADNPCSINIVPDQGEEFFPRRKERGKGTKHCAMVVATAK